MKHYLNRVIFLGSALYRLLAVDLGSVDSYLLAELEVCFIWAAADNIPRVNQTEPKLPTFVFGSHDCWSFAVDSLRKSVSTATGKSMFTKPDKNGRRMSRVDSQQNVRLRSGLVVTWHKASFGNLSKDGKLCQNTGAVWKSRWTSWAPVPNNPPVSVDVKRHFNHQLSLT